MQIMKYCEESLIPYKFVQLVKVKDDTYFTHAIIQVQISYIEVHQLSNLQALYHHFHHHFQTNYVKFKS